MHAETHEFIASSMVTGYTSQAKPEPFIPGRGVERVGQLDLPVILKLGRIGIFSSPLHSHAENLLASSCW
jgi:hypothetical protein